MLGYVISCISSVANRKLQGPKLKLKPIICANMSKYSMYLSSGAAHQINASSILETIIILWPYNIKERLPYFYRNCPANKVTTTCKKVNLTNAQVISLAVGPPTCGKTVPAKANEVLLPEN